MANEGVQKSVIESDYLIKWCFENNRNNHRRRSPAKGKSAEDRSIALSYLIAQMGVAELTGHICRYARVKKNRPDEETALDISSTTSTWLKGYPRYLISQHRCLAKCLSIRCKSEDIFIYEYEYKNEFIDIDSDIVYETKNTSYRQGAGHWILLALQE